MTVNSSRQVSYASGEVTTSDALELYWQSWRPQTPVGVIVLVHGLADHSSRFKETAGYFAARGWAVFAVDFRGHGLSSDGHKPGRVHVNHFDDYTMDVEAIMALATSLYPDKPCVIMGHSMGGLVSLRYALDHPGELAGAVISSPMLAPHPDSRIPKLLELLVRVLSVLTPRLLFPTELDASAVSRDPAVVKAYSDDPLVSGKISARWYTAANLAMTEMRGRAAEISIPLLLMQSGADKLVDSEATRRWAKGVPAKNLEFIVWDDLYHEMFNEAEKGLVRERVSNWLRKLPGVH
jgi:alpha-beta hydrolase superfamily lysophospholipase